MVATAHVVSAGVGAAARDFESPAAPFAGLRHAEVHAWIIDLDAPADCSDDPLALLEDAERDRMTRYLSPRDGARFAASRAGLRRILGGYLGTDPAGLRFRTAPGGRPRLAGQHRSPVQFSLSRSAGVALLAVSAGQVGADVEAIEARDGLPDLAAARFGRAEADCVATGRCAGSPLRSFYRHWTAREAWLKAVGIGLAGLRDAEFDCRDDLAMLFRGTAVIPADLRLQLFDISPAHAAAVAAAGPVTTFRRLPAGSRAANAGG